MLLRMAIWLWMLPMDSPQPSLFLRQHCDSTMSSLFWRHFSNSFALSELYFFFTLATNIYTYQMLVYLDFFLQFHSMISNSNKITYYFYLYLYYSIFLSYPNQKCRPPIKAVYQVLCLKRLRAKAHFVKYETKLLRIFFFLLPPTTYYFAVISGILFTWKLCEVAILSLTYQGSVLPPPTPTGLWLK